MSLNSKTLQSSNYIKLSSNIYYKEAEAVILLSPDKKHIIKIDGVIREIWESVKSGTTFGAIVDEIEKKFDIDRETIIADLSKWLSEANEEKLIEITD